MLPEWTEAIICPIFKKGDKSEYQNYNVAHKILARWIKSRLLKNMESIVGEYQSSFRRATTDQLFILREIQAKSYEFEKETSPLFIDFKYVYDRVNRKEMYKALSELVIKEKLIRMMHLTLEMTKNRVRVKSRTSQKFKVGKGVRQGDPLSPVEFNLILNKIIREANINRTRLLYQKRHQCLAYVDDLVIISHSKKNLKKVVTRLEKKARGKGCR